MPNPIKGETPLKLNDGRQFTLVLDMEALVQAEGAYGKPLPKMMEDASAGFVGASRALLYGALLAKHPRITLAEATALFMADADAVGEALSEAVERGFPDAKASAEGNGQSALPGKPSGASGAKRGSNQKASGK